jgi:hypothetical protein
MHKSVHTVRTSNLFPKVQPWPTRSNRHGRDRKLRISVAGAAYFDRTIHDIYIQTNENPDPLIVCMFISIRRGILESTPLSMQASAAPQLPRELNSSRELHWILAPTAAAAAGVINHREHEKKELPLIEHTDWSHHKSLCTIHMLLQVGTAT